MCGVCVWVVGANYHWGGVKQSNQAVETGMERWVVDE